MLAGRVECQSQGGGSSGHTHMHAHSHTNTSHTFRGGRRRADMKRCYLRGRKKKGEKSEKRRGGAKKKKLQHSSLHHVHSEGEELGGCPDRWMRQKVYQPYSHPAFFLFHRHKRSPRALFCS